MEKSKRRELVLSVSVDPFPKNNDLKNKYDAFTLNAVADFVVLLPFVNGKKIVEKTGSPLVCLDADDKCFIRSVGQWEDKGLCRQKTVIGRRI